MYLKTHITPTLYIIYGVFKLAYLLCDGWPSSDKSFSLNICMESLSATVSSLNECLDHEMSTLRKCLSISPVVYSHRVVPIGGQHHCRSGSMTFAVDNRQISVVGSDPALDLLADKA